METTNAALTTNDIHNGYLNPEWQGFGFLGERMRALDAVRSGEWTHIDEDDINLVVDDFVVAYANRKHWTPERFFQWLNSANGRHYGDSVFGMGEDPAKFAEQLIR